MQVAAADVAHYFSSSAGASAVGAPSPAGKPRGDAGMALSRDNLRFAADVALRAHDGGTEVLPKVSSTLALAPRVDLETRLDLAEWNSGSRLLDAKFATRLHVQAPAPFLDELEGRFWRMPDGRTGRLLGLGFYQRLGNGHGPNGLTLRTRATLETASDATQRVAFETELGGLQPSAAAGRAALRLKVVRNSGVAAATAHSVAYDRSWTLPSTAEVAFNLGMLRSTSVSGAAVEPTLGMSWRAGF
jgi:hypothetical protein